MLKGGAATGYDVLRIEVQLNEAKTDLISANDQVVITREDLDETLGNASDPRTLQGELPVPDPTLETKIGELDLPGRSDFQAASMRTDSLAQAESEALSFWIPKLSLSGQYSFYNDLDSSLANTSLFRSAYSVGLFLSWNLFDGSAYARAKEASSKTIQSEKDLEAKRLHLPHDLTSWKKRYHYSTALYSARRSDVEKSLETVRLAQEGYRAGTRTSTEILDAELDLIRARAGVVNAQLASVEALINLELAIGHAVSASQ